MVKVSYEQFLPSHGGQWTYPGDHRRGGRSWPSTRAPLSVLKMPSLRRWRPPPPARGLPLCWGRCSNQVLLHQSVIGLETKAAMDSTHPGGHRHRLRRGRVHLVAHLPLCGGRSPGEADYRDHRRGACLLPQPHPQASSPMTCDTGMVCPPGQDVHPGLRFHPSANHAGGLRYHGMSPVVSQLYHDGPH